MDKLKSKSDVAYQWIKEQIIVGAFPPLSDLSDHELQIALDMSRTPVREALLRLEQDSLVIIYPRKGTIVTDVTRDMIDKVYEVRRLIEPTISVDVMDQLDRDWLLDMQEKLTHPPAGEDGKVKGTDDKVRHYFIELDDLLHRTIIEHCSNQYLSRAMFSVHDQNRRLRYATSHPMVGDDTSVDEHLRIVEALLAWDEEQVYAATLEHLERSYKRTHRKSRSPHPRV